MEKYKPVKSLLKGLKILEAFTSPEQALSFRELTLKTGMPKATVFRFFHTLASQNYLSFDSKSKKYYLPMLLDTAERISAVCGFIKCETRI